LISAALKRGTDRQTTKHTGGQNTRERERRTDRWIDDSEVDGESGTNRHTFSVIKKEREKYVRKAEEKYFLYEK
jgi:hypothetical protein